MNISTDAIVSNSEIIKNYKSCREKADNFGKIFVFKNNQLDAVLFSIAEYERVSVIIEYINGFEEKDIEKFMERLSRKDDENIFKNNITI